MAESGLKVLPDAPLAQQAPEQQVPGQQASENQSLGQIGANAPIIPRSPSLITRPIQKPLGQLGLGGKFHYYVDSEFGPANFAIPAAGALYRMANPTPHLPREWKDGGGAFGRNYGDILASDFSEKTARFATGAILREEPRYFPSQSDAFAARVFHALRYTLIDKADSGRDRVAISNFAGAAAGGFVGNAYLPPGYRSAAHAGQRSLLILVGLAGENEASEFQPEIRVILKRLHVPFIK